jgi:hypothetical protein
MTKISMLVFVVLATVSIASAQTEADLRSYFEGKQVTLKLDMPATKDGVDIYPEREQPLNYSEYATRLKQHGTAIRRGDSIMVTKIKVKDKHIEFQLGGGGYGTFGDESGGSSYVSNAPKSRREKFLEEEVKREQDPERRKRLKHELDELRRKREREDRENRVLAAAADEERRARIDQKAVQAGSRFNIHFNSADSPLLTPEGLREALRQYLEIEHSDQTDDSLQQQVSYRYYRGGLTQLAVVRVGPPTTYLREGLALSEVIRFLGEPLATSTREENGLTITSCEFQRGDDRVLIAEFANDILRGSRIALRAQTAPGN